MKSVNDGNFSSEVLENTRPVVVDCWAEWCGPCRMATPIFEKLAEQYGEQVECVKLNVDESPETSVKYGIMSIPTFLAFKNGVLVSKQIGASSKAIEDAIKSCI
jgi:thioredoxin 1